MCFSEPWVNPYERASPEKLLCRDLLRKYHSLGLNGRPVMDRNRNLTVRLRLGLIQIDLDEKSRILTLSVWSIYVSIVGVTLREVILRIITLSVWADYVSKVDAAISEAILQILSVRVISSLSLPGPTL